MSNVLEDNTRQLIVLAAPDVNDEYYRKHFKGIIDFDIEFAKAILGKDNCVVLVNKKTLPYFRGKLPDDVLLVANIHDIWIRDFSPQIPKKLVSFQYDRKGKERTVQKSLLKLLDQLGVKYHKSKLKVDGGNIVDNGHDKIVMTEKVFLRNKDWEEDEVVEEIMEKCGVSEVAFIPMDDEKLGHSDGMVSFVDKKNLLVSEYDDEPSFDKKVHKGLKESLSDVKYTIIQNNYKDEKFSGGFASAYGMYVNSCVTHKYVYMPTFGDDKKFDSYALKTYIGTQTKKTIIPIDCSSVCFMGGNCRCLSWQLNMGENAKKLIIAARKSFSKK